MLAAARAAHEVFSKHVDGLVDRLLDTLFRYAESKLGSDEQRRTLSAYSAIYENRSAFLKRLDQAMQSRLQQSVEDFLNNRLTSPGTQTSAPVERLSLIDTGEVDRQVIASSLGNRAENDCAEAFEELRARLASVAGLSELSPGSNPFRGELMVYAVDEAWRDTKPEALPQLLLVERLTVAVLGDLSDYAQAVNSVLAQAGYEPVSALGTYAASGRNPVRQAAAEPLPAASMAPAAPPAPRHQAGLFRRIAEAMARQFSMGRGDAVGPSGAPQPSETRAVPAAAPQAVPNGVDPTVWQVRQQAFERLVPSVAAGSPLSALSALQRAQVEQPADFGQALAVHPLLDESGDALDSNYMDPLSAVDVVLRSPLNFVNVVRSIAQTPIGQNADPVNATVIELVARLFDFVFEDKNLPDAIKVLLSRLQIPVLKAAMLDTEFFERDDHPARQLVNALANAGIGWDEADGRDDPLFVLIEKTVARVLEEFAEDLALFEQLTHEVNDYVEQIERETLEAAAPQLEVVQTQAIREEDLQLACKKARLAVEDRLRESKTAPFVADFLRLTWADYLGELLTDQVPTDEPLKNALDTADDLLWSVEPKRVPEERRHLLIKIPPLERQLRSGMGRVSMPAFEQQEFLIALDDRWAGAVIGEPIHVLKELPPPEADPEPDAAALLILDLRIGAIIEITKDDGSRHCYKLGWISEGRTRYLLTNRLNSAPLIVTGEHLAERLRTEHMRIIDRGSLVDRAMNSILTALEEVRYPDPQVAL